MPHRKKILLSDSNEALSMLLADSLRERGNFHVFHAKDEDEKYLKLMEDNGIKIVRFTDEEIEMFAEAVRTNVWPQLAKTYGEDFINELLKLYK